MILRRDVPEGASFFAGTPATQGHMLYAPAGRAVCGTAQADIESAPAGIQYVKFKLFYNNVTIFERI
jgi:hypothetical protein